MSIVDRLRALLDLDAHQTVAPIADHLDGYQITRLPDRERSISDPVAPNPDPDLALDLFDDAELEAAFDAIRSHLYVEGVTSWGTSALPPIPEALHPVVAAWLRVLEDEIPSHRWNLRWRLADIADHYGASTRRTTAEETTL